MEHLSHKRTFEGVVVSDKMTKTLVVRVDRTKMHPKYKKRYTISSRFHVHDEYEKFKVGDKVKFEETRPMSRMKRWRVLGEKA